jgi:Domain of unknown function (DUF1744)
VLRCLFVITGPTCIITQTAVPPLSLRSSLSALNDYPVIPMPSNGDDGRYPTLGWLSYAGQRMIQVYIQLIDYTTHCIITYILHAQHAFIHYATCCCERILQ